MLQVRSRFARHFVALALFALTVASAPFAFAQQVTTIAGGFVGDGLNRTAAGLNLPGEIAFDASGNLYVADTFNHRVRKVTPAGVVSTYAGTGDSGYGGDGGAATLAKLNEPWGLAFDSAGNLYISEYRGNRIRKVTTGGVISTVVGDGTTAILNGPKSLEVSPDGTTLYFSEPTQNRVRKAVNGVVSAFAGTGTVGNTGDNGPATSARLRYPLGLLLQADGSVLIADTKNHRIRRVDSAGTITLWRAINWPYGFAKDGSGVLHLTTDNGIFVDNGSTFVAEAGDAFAPWGFDGESGSASGARFYYPYSIAFAADGRMFISDQSNNRIRVLSGGTIATYMGPGRPTEGGNALGARVSSPAGLVYDSAGNLYVSESFNNTIRKITPAGVISTYAGNGLGDLQNSNGDGNSPLAAMIFEPHGLAIAPGGDLLVVEAQRNDVRRITPAGQVSTISIDAADMGNPYPDQVATDAVGNIYVSGISGISRIRNDGGPTVIWVGNGTSTGTYPENVPATQTPTGDIGQMGFDAAGNLYYADRNFNTVRKVTPDGLVSTVAGVPNVSGNDGDGGPATAAHLLHPHALIVEADGSFVVGDDNGRFRRVSNGTIQALAGAGTAGYNGDGAASSTMFDYNSALTRAPNGSLAIADEFSNRVRTLPFGNPSLPGISISDASTQEGNSGTKTLTFTVSLSSPASSTVTFNVATSDGTAKAGEDYVALSLSGVTIAAGQSSKSISVTINGDTNFEPDESFQIALTGVTGATVVDPTAGGVIRNDDAAPVLSIADVSVAEGDTGTKTMTFTVTASYAPVVPITYGIYTEDGTASSFNDYTGPYLAGETIAPGTTSRTYSVTVNGDTTLEADETFLVKLTNITNATMPVPQAQGTILNDDAPPPPPTVSIHDAEVSEGDSGETDLQFQVAFSRETDREVTFTLTTSDLAATAGSDYVAQSQSYTVPAGTLFFYPVVKVKGDHLVEPDEGLTAGLSNVVGATIDDGQAVGTIKNDDYGQGGVFMAMEDAWVAEGDSGQRNAYVTVRLSQPSTDLVWFSFQLTDGTATLGQDYVAPAEYQVNIDPGLTTKTFAIPLVGDTQVEGDEDFFVSFYSYMNATPGNAGATVTIVDDESGPPPLMLSVTDALFVDEGNSGTKTATFYVNLSAPSASPVTVDLHTVDGTAVAGSDYVQKSGQVVIPAGQTSAAFTVTTKGDTEAEADEQFGVQASNASGATIVDATGQGVIRNDDNGAPGPTLSINDVSIAEGDSSTKNLMFTVKLSAAQPGPVTFNFATADGTATAGSDYIAKPTTNLSIAAGATVKQFTIAVKGDTTFEPDETFLVNLSNAVGATIADGQGVGTITNDDAAAPPALSIADASVSEGNAGTKVLTFTVNLSGPASGPVSYDIATSDGSATAGSDYVAASLVGQTIAAGVTSKTFAVTINGDTTVEANETFNVTVSNVTGATVADGAAVGTISNDDVSAGPTLSINDVSIAEGDSLTKNLMFTVRLSAAQPGPVTFDFATADGTATAGSDYIAKPTTNLSIAAGATVKQFTIAIKGDTTFEPDETFLVNLSNAVGATIADGQGVGTITNDDAAAPPALSIADASVSEGNAGTKVLTFTVNLSGPASGPVSYDIATSNGTATAGSDYVAASLVGQTIAAGVTSKTFAVTINGDTTVEANETFNVTVSNVTGATVADGAAVGTISNDDVAAGPTLSIGDVSIVEGNALTKQAVFTVTLSAAASTAVTYNIATANGTAVAPGDYTAKSLTAQSIPAGTLSRTFVVVVKGDRLVEPNETFLVNVTNVTGATIADGQAVGTITNDDAAALSVARFDAQGLVDDVDDGNRQPQIAPKEYATLLADSANSLCRRAPDATVIAVEGVEHARVLADLADAASAVCASKPKYTAVMADHDSRGFLIAVPADGELGTSVLQAPQVNVAAKSTALEILGAGHATPVTLVLASGTSKALFDQLQLRAKSNPDEAVVVLGANKLAGLVDLTARALTPTPSRKQPHAPPVLLPEDRVLVNGALLRLYRTPAIELAPLPAKQVPAQVVKLQ